MDTPKILMSRENPNGWKLESILEKIQGEVQDKTDYIKESDHPLRNAIIGNNSRICELLAEARSLQVSTYKQLNMLSPDKGPLSPRL